MAEGNESQDRPGDLRRRAEELLRKQGADRGAGAPEQTQHLLHELQVHQIELEMQNEELRQAQEKLEASRSRYFDLYDLAPVGYFTLSEQGLILEANLTAATLLGVPRSSMVKQPITGFFFRDDQDIFYLHRKQLFETGAPQVFEMRVMRQGGATFWARLEATAARDGEGGPPVCRAVMSDITERKRAESQRDAMLEELKAALAEKEVLMREIYHRVKNNVQALIYLMEMQAAYIPDAAARQMIQELQERARAMALVHEKLYQSRNLAQIDFAAYLHDLVASLSRAFEAGWPISWWVKADTVLLGVDSAIPCGLVVTELLTNALKYAFPGGRPCAERGETECKIGVEFRAVGDQLRLVVADNGVGLPPGLDWQTTKSLGLQLINVLVHLQLGGQVEVDSHRGTTFKITFVEQKKANRP